jgi:TrmH family RNA methyltransferase
LITSFRNPRISEVRRLKRRRERRVTGRTTVDGPFLLHEAVAAGVKIIDVFALPEDVESATAADRAGVELTEVSADVLQRLASSVNPRGPIAVIDIPKPAAVASVDSVVLWEVSDPGNAGTIIRTAAAFGFQVLATPETVDLWAPKVLRAAVGGHFRTPVVEAVEGLDALDRAGLIPLATAADGVDIRKVDLADESPVAFIIGNEAHGVSAEIMSRAATVALPMPGGTESLNAGVAAGVLMYLRMSRRP